jgi:hypothetical protein
MEFKKIMDNMVCWFTINIQTCGYFIHFYATILLHDCFNRCNALWCHHSEFRTVCYRTNAVHELLIPLIHLLQWQTCITLLNFHSLMNFDGFHPFTTPFFGACCNRVRHLYTTTAPSCCIPASYCQLLAILQTMSIIVVNLEENCAVIRIFIALLRFSFDCPWCVCEMGNSTESLWRELQSSDIFIVTHSLTNSLT